MPGLPPQKPMKVFVVLLFSASFFVNASFITKMDVGLEQDLSMPDDSYVKKYFDVSSVLFLYTKRFEFN